MRKWPGGRKPGFLNSIIAGRARLSGRRGAVLEFGIRTWKHRATPFRDSFAKRCLTRLGRRAGCKHRECGQPLKKGRPGRRNVREFWKLVLPGVERRPGEGRGRAGIRCVKDAFPDAARSQLLKLVPARQ